MLPRLWVLGLVLIVGDLSWRVLVEKMEEEEEDEGDDDSLLVVVDIAVL